MISPTLNDVFDHPRLSQSAAELFENEDLDVTRSLALAKTTSAVKYVIDPLIDSATEQFLNVDLTDIVLGAWKQVEALREYADGGKLFSEDTQNFILTEHKIISKHTPRIELQVHQTTIRELSIDITLKLLVAKTILKILKGRIMEIRISGCQASGDIKYKGLTIVEKHSRLLEFPQSIALGRGIPIPPPLESLPG